MLPRSPSKRGWERIKIAGGNTGTGSFDEGHAFFIAAEQRERFAHHEDAGRKISVDLQVTARLFQCLLWPLEQKRVNRAIRVEECAKRIEFHSTPDRGQRLVSRA